MYLSIKNPILLLVLTTIIYHCSLSPAHNNVRYLVMPGLDGQGLEDRLRSGVTHCSYPQTLFDGPLLYFENDLGQSNWKSEFFNKFIIQTTSVLYQANDLVFVALGTGAHGLLCTFKTLPEQVQTRVKAIYLESSLLRIINEEYAYCYHAYYLYCVSIINPIFLQSSLDSIVSKTTISLL